MELGYRLYCDENGKFEADDYKKMVEYCKANNLSIEDHRPKYFKVVENTQPTSEQIKTAKIAELKANLDATDYVVIKIAEGVAAQDEYADVIKQRQAWRLEINKLEETKDVSA